MSEDFAMSATVVDRFSKPLTDLKNKLAAISAPRGAREIERSFASAQRSAQALTQSISGGLEASFVRLGATIGGVTGAFYAVTSAVKRFSDEIPKLQQLSRETGVSLNNLRALQSVAGKVGIEAGTVEQAVKAAAENAHEMVRRRGSVWAELVKFAPNLASGMREVAVKGDMEKFVSMGIDAVMQIRKEKGPVMARYYSELLFGGADLSRFSAMGKEKLIAELRKDYDKLFLSPEQIQRAEQTRVSIADMQNTMTMFGNVVASEIAPGLDKFAKAMEEAFGAKSESWIKRETLQFFKDLSKTLEELSKIIKGDFGLSDMFQIKPGGILGTDPSVRARKLTDERAQIQQDLDAELRAGNQPRVKALQRSLMGVDEELRKLKDAVKEGVKEGMQEGQKQGSVTPSGFQYASMSGGPGFGGRSSPGGLGGITDLRDAVPSMGATGRRLGGRGGVGGESGATGDAAPFRSGGAAFNEKAPAIMARLQKDFGLSREQAAGIVGNFGHETGGFKHHQEINPIGGGRGGIGWPQWTGSRRRAYEAWSKQRGLDPRSDEANYGFLSHELRTSHAGALAAVRRQSTPEGAMREFERTFEGSGVKAWGSRMAWTRRAMGLPEAPGDAAAAPGGPVPMWMRGGIAPRLPGGSQFQQPQAEDPFSRLNAASAFAARPQGQASSPSGTASLDITLNGFPSGWRTRAQGGSLFKDVQVNTGKAMVPASEAQ